MAKASDKKEVFAKLPVPTALRTMIVPAIISQVIILIYNMADTYYIGRTDNPYMVAGASLLLPVFNMLVCVSSLAGIGGGTLISRLLGKEDEKEAKKVSAFSLKLAAAVALCFSIVMGLLLEPILRFLGAGSNTLLYAKQYAFCVIVLGAVPTVLSSVFAHLIRSIGMSKEAVMSVSVFARVWYRLWHIIIRPEMRNEWIPSFAFRGESV